jgi:Zn-dependent protease
MNGSNNIRIGTLFGIPFFLNPSWFLILGLVTWTYGNDLAQDFPTLLPGVPLVLGLVTGLLLFSSVVAHELGHSWVAIKQGIPVRSITLFILIRWRSKYRKRTYHSRKCFLGIDRWPVGELFAMWLANCV